MKVLLVKPSVTDLYSKVNIIFPPMELMSLAAVLEKGNNDVEIGFLIFISPN